MARSRRQAVVAAALLLGAGCGEQPAAAVAAGGGSTGAGAGGDAGFTVSGTVLDLDGAPVVDMFVTVSTELCIPDRTGADGGFAVEHVSAGPKRLITYGETAQGGGVASLLFAFEADGPLSFPAPLRDPVFEERWPIDPQAPDEQLVTTAAGLTLSVAPGSLELAPFAPAELQLARVPLAAAPPIAPAGVTLIELFALGPIRSILDPPAAVRFPPQSELAPGASVLFHQLDYDTGVMKPVAHGSVDPQGRPTTSPGEGLSELTWVGVAVDPTQPGDPHAFD